MLNQTQNQGFAVGDVPSILLRYKKTVLLLPLLILLFGAMAILFWPRVYRSEAKLFLRVGRETVGLDPSATTGQTISLQQSGRNDEVKSAIDILRSRNVYGLVVDQLGADVVLGKAGVGVSKPNPVGAAVGSLMGLVGNLANRIDPVAEREKAIIRIQKKIQVEAERDSTVIDIRFDAKNPRLAQSICDAIVKAYQAEHMRIHRNAGSSAFFEGQRDQLREQLDVAVQDVRDAKIRMGLATIGGRRQTLESQISNIELARYSAEQERSLAVATMIDIRKQLVEIPERITGSKKSIPNYRGDLLSEQLYGVQLQEMALAERYSDSHPLLLAIRNQLTDAKKQVAELKEDRFETTDDVNPIHRELSLDFKKQQSVAVGLDARIAKLSQQHQNLHSEIEAVNRFEVELDQLDREANLARTKFYKYSESLEQARIDQAMALDSISNVSIAQDPSLSEKPISPSKTMVGLATLALALGGTASVILVRERLNDRIRNEREVEQLLQIPVLAAIPDEPAPSRVLVG